MTEVSSMPPRALDSSNGHFEFQEKSENLRSSPTSGEIKRNNENGQTDNPVESKPNTNGDISSPQKSQSKLPGPTHKNSSSLSTGTPLKSPGTPKAKLPLPKPQENVAPATPANKKLPMNKIQVGAAPSPNLKAAKSKVGSLANTTHKPGGGNVRIESRKMDFSKAHSRIEAKNDQYVRSGGDKKIPQVKLQWEAKSKVGSLENSTYKPGGGDKKIESVKLDFKEKAKPKVGSKDNVKHVPGGGAVKIESQKLEFKAQSKVGSLDNVKHKPGGGEIKIFDDKTYLKQISATNSEGRVSGTQSFGDLFLHVGKEGGGRSIPGTPGPRTRPKIDKSKTIKTSESMPLVRATQISAVSSPVKEKKFRTPQPKQENKLMFSKVQPTKMIEKKPIENLNEMDKIPLDYNSPIRKTNIFESETNKHYESSASSKTHEMGYTPLIEQTKLNKERANYANSKQNLENFAYDKLIVQNGSDTETFMTTKLKAEEIGIKFKETNIMDNNVIKSNMESQQDMNQAPNNNQSRNPALLILPESSLQPESVTEKNINEKKINFGIPQLSNPSCNSSKESSLIQSNRQPNHDYQTEEVPIMEQVGQQAYPVSSLQQQQQQTLTDSQY